MAEQPPTSRPDTGAVRRRAKNLAVAGMGALVLGLAPPLLAPPAVARQDAARPNLPAPEECLVEPRPLPLALAGPATPAASPVAPVPVASPSGTPLPPADAETVAALEATVREALACRNGGDFRRAYALMTDAMLVDLLGTGNATVPPEIADLLLARPRRLPRPLRLELVAVTDVARLPDGRVRARVETRNLRYAWVDDLTFALDPATGRWLIDAAAAVSVTRR